MLIITKKMYKALWWGLLFSVIEISALIYIYTSFPCFLDQREYKWPKTNGKIILIKNYPVVTGASSRQNAQLLPRIHYKSKAKYTYKVNGRNYYHWSYDESLLTNFYVYYNPNNPWQSTLNPGPRCKPLVGIIITIITIAVYFYVIKPNFLKRLLNRIKNSM